jgi:hypothetical protein
MCSSGSGRSQFRLPGRDVWICQFADGHIQAMGRDAKRRKQYRYHVRFREVRESAKYEHVVAFADALPGLREKVQEHHCADCCARRFWQLSFIFWRRRLTGTVIVRGDSSSG